MQTICPGGIGLLQTGVFSSSRSTSTSERVCHFLAEQNTARWIQKTEATYTSNQETTENTK